MAEKAKITSIYSFDGQTVWINKSQSLYDIGNFLGGGAAGTVYEAEHAPSQKHFAIKILNPLGYKLLSPALLRRCTVISKGVTVANVFDDNMLTVENVWWLMNGGTKQYIAAYFTERHGLKELSLNQCISVWGTDPAQMNALISKQQAVNAAHLVANINGGSLINRNPTFPPAIPPKFLDFATKRDYIFREINNMCKISHHPNVIELHEVLELTQDSKCTIFLVMELANGGELFDRIKIDYGTREDTANLFFLQLLRGVRHCHEQGVCHRDLKPENLLLSDSDNVTVLKIADFGFSAQTWSDDYSTHNANWATPAVASRTNDGRCVTPTMMVHSLDEGHKGGSPDPMSSSLPLDSKRVDKALYSESPMRVLKSVVGSPYYVAPEVLQSSGYDGSKADIWSLGVILYAMLAGNLPFGQELTTCKRFRQFGKWVRELSSAQSPSVRSVGFFIDESVTEYPSWLFPAKFSSLAKGLIVSMLHPDPGCRISVLEAQQHAWCITNAATTVPVETKEELKGDADETESMAHMTSISSTHSNVSKPPCDLPGMASLHLHENEGLENGLQTISHVTSVDIEESESEDDSILCDEMFPMDMDDDEYGDNSRGATWKDSVSPDRKYAVKGDILVENDTNQYVDKYGSTLRISANVQQQVVHGNKRSSAEMNNTYQGFVVSPESNKDYSRKADTPSLSSSGGGDNKSGKLPDCTPPRKPIPSSLLDIFDKSDSSGGPSSKPAPVNSNPFEPSQPLPIAPPSQTINAFSSMVPEDNNSMYVHSYPYPEFSETGQPVPQQTNLASSFSNFMRSNSPAAPMAYSCPAPPVPSFICSAVTTDLLNTSSDEDGEEPPVSSPDAPLAECCSAESLSSSLSSPMAFPSPRANVLGASDGVAFRALANNNTNSGGTVAAPPSFSDLVKRSSRFITSVPATEVLDKVECLLEMCRLQKVETPLGSIGRVVLNWNAFRLEVWSSLDHFSGPPSCALQLYQMPNTTPNSTPNPMFASSPSFSLASSLSNSNLAGSGPVELFLVEFIRGQLDIFVFKRFYQWVRQRLTELVKRDYNFRLFDQANSPSRESSLCRPQLNTSY